MFSAPSRLVFVAALSVCAVATLFAAVSSAQTTIDLSLNVFYQTPSDVASGGHWELVAKSSPSPATYGISGLTALISRISGDAVIEAPRATVNGGNPAGFRFLDDIFHEANNPQPAYHELILAQVPIYPLPPGNEESYFYGVGTVANGAPEYATKPPGSVSIGPAFTSLTNPQGIAWAKDLDPLGQNAWNFAVRMASGSFAAGVTPGFISGSSGNVFTSVPLTNNTLGNEVLASSITTIVRTNFAPAVQSADYNSDGIVDARDYVIWRKTFGATVAPGTGADGNHDGSINPPDYTLWRAHFGNPTGAGSGAGLSSMAVPEPTTCLLLSIGAVLAIAPRRSQKRQLVNN